MSSSDTGRPDRATPTAMPMLTPHVPVQLPPRALSCEAVTGWLCAVERAARQLRYQPETDALITSFAMRAVLSLPLCGCLTYEQATEVVPALWVQVRAEHQA